MLAVLLVAACLTSLRAQNAAPGATPGAGQNPPAADLSQTPTIRSNTREVVEDIVVTDSNGAQVTGLHPSDFEIFENKKPQTIGFFEEHSARALPPGALKPLPPMPPNVFTNVPPAP